MIFPEHPTVEIDVEVHSTCKTCLNYIDGIMEICNKCKSDLCGECSNWNDGYCEDCFEEYKDDI